MTMYEVWMRTWETGEIDTVIYVRAESVDAAFNYCGRFRETHSAKTVLPEGEWLTEEVGLSKWTEEELEVA